MPIIWAFAIFGLIATHGLAFWGGLEFGQERSRVLAAQAAARKPDQKENCDVKPRKPQRCDCSQCPSIRSPSKSGPAPGEKDGFTFAPGKKLKE